MKKFIIPIVMVLGLAAVSGCVTRSITRNEPRTQVSFASATAAQVFYDAYLARNHPNPVPITNTSTNIVVNNIWISFRLPYWQYHNVSENVRFNRAVAAADTNHDAVISEAEAQAYAAKPAQRAQH